MHQKAIYPGTFDPITNGHLDIIQRAALLFPQVVVAVAKSAEKRPLLNQASRMALIQEACGKDSKIQVLGFEGLLIDFLRKEGANIIIRGLRVATDFDYELQLAGMNRAMAKDIETVFLTPSAESMFISSTLVREIAAMGGDVSPFVPKAVVSFLQSKR